jgi:trans-aconitate 2-methyltransferase
MCAQPVKWNVDQYSKFIDERTRPAAELLARISLETVSQAVDLGCGPGNSTALLKQRWPNANIIGVDNSDEMLAAARKEHPDLTFVHADISQWEPPSSVDLIFSNAAFQWVPNHEKLLARLARFLNKGGFLAMQVPNNHEEPTHTSMRRVATNHNWSVDLSQVRQQPPVLPAQAYYDILSPHLKAVDIWETRYFHLMDSFAEIAEWLKGTGLRPFLAPLRDDEKERLIHLYTQELEKLMQRQADGKVLLPFPRLFVAGCK